MKIALRFLCLGFFLAAMPRVSPAASVLFDNFDSYANNADFNAAWTINAASGLSLDTVDFVSFPNSAVNPTYTNAASSREQMAPVDALLLNFSFRFYDYTGVNSRDYAQLYSRAGNSWTDPVNNILRIGKYNSIATSKYYGYIFLSSGVTPGDGASALASGWFALGGAADRSVGWHEAQIIGEADPANAGKALYLFYIDGVLGGSLANATAPNYNWAVLGSGLTTASPIAFDDVSVAAIPEPSAFVLSLLGMAALVYRRRLQCR